MKTIHGWLVVSAAGLLLLASGCGVQRVVWSPDGTRAAVMGEQGLCFSDPEGKVSGVLVSNVAMAEWFPDSHKLALVRATKTQSWADFQTHLRPEDRDSVVQQGQSILKEWLNTGRDWKAALNGMENSGAVALYFKSLDGVKEKVGADWAELDQKDATLMNSTSARSMATRSPWARRSSRPCNNPCLWACAFPPPAPPSP